ncbi:hypothetical protein HYPSUDRAFT_578043 [Hypholoma sublateritium FD-334 SS-4]|uniref:Uncharacterized protein n=1 Tax=Hypholoma sublateritium (strain FD-334 SS-4) TaxID=945553 RepID=A0A0D2L8E9_HYPSF|nr:hypothetical protein HYPSUDRAFT_578043 [Hypholoma sublateritium FD-334 SS-4]
MSIWHGLVFRLEKVACIAFACIQLGLFVPLACLITGGGHAQLVSITSSFLQHSFRCLGLLCGARIKGCLANTHTPTTNYDHGYRPRPPNRASSLRRSEATQEEEAGETRPTGGRGWCCCTEG